VHTKQRQPKHKQFIARRNKSYKLKKKEKQKPSLKFKTNSDIKRNKFPDNGAKNLLS